MRMRGIPGVLALLILLPFAGCATTLAQGLLEPLGDAVDEFLCGDSGEDSRSPGAQPQALIRPVGVTNIQASSSQTKQGPVPTRSAAHASSPRHQPSNGATTRDSQAPAVFVGGEAVHLRAERAPVSLSRPPARAPRTSPWPSHQPASSATDVSTKSMPVAEHARQFTEIREAYAAFRFNEVIRKAEYLGARPEVSIWLLAEAYIYAGAAAYLQGDTPAARSWFRRAISACSSVTPSNAVFPTTVHGLYREEASTSEQR